MKHCRMEGVSIIMICLSALGNAVHLLWTFWLIDEQIKTGWGYGTNIELGVLYPWITEILCAPILIAGIVYLILAISRKPRKALLIPNIILFVLLVMQYALTNLFIWY